MYNETNANIKPSTFLKTIMIIHGILLAGIILFCIAVVFTTNNPVINLNAVNDPLFYVVPSITILGLIAGIYLFKQRLSKLTDTNSLIEKLNIYQNALITRYACTEGPAIFGIVAFLDSGNLFYIVITAVNVLYFLWMRPTKFKTEDDLNLSYEDKIAMEG